MKDKEIKAAQDQIYISMDSSAMQLATVLHQNKKLKSDNKILNEQEEETLYTALGIMQSHPMKFEYSTSYK